MTPSAACGCSSKAGARTHAEYATPWTSRGSSRPRLSLTTQWTLPTTPSRALPNPCEGSGTPICQVCSHPGAHGARFAETPPPQSALRRPGVVHSCCACRDREPCVQQARHRLRIPRLRDCQARRRRKQCASPRLPSALHPSVVVFLPSSHHKTPTPSLPAPSCPPTCLPGRFLPFLIAFGERTALGAEAQHAQLELALSSALPTIQDLLAFSEQLRQAAGNLFGQLASLYADKQRLYAPLKLVRLSTAFQALGDALGTLFAVDECIRNSAALPTAFALLRRSIDQIELEPGRFSLDPANAAALDAALSALEAKLLPATLLEDALNVLTLSFGPPPKRLCDELAVHAQLAMEAALGRITAGSERPSDRADLVSGLLLAALHTRLAPLAPDRKLVQCAWGVVKRVHALPVAQHLSVQPLDILLRLFAPAAVQMGPKDPQEVAIAARREALDSLAESVPREAAVFEAQAAAWLARTDSALVPSTSLAVSVVLGLRLRLLVRPAPLSFATGAPSAAPELLL